MPERTANHVKLQSCSVGLTAHAQSRVLSFATILCQTPLKKPKPSLVHHLQFAFSLYKSAQCQDFIFTGHPNKPGEEGEEGAMLDTSNENTRSELGRWTVTHTVMMRSRPVLEAPCQPGR